MTPSTTRPSLPFLFFLVVLAVGNTAAAFVALASHAWLGVVMHLLVASFLARMAFPRQDGAS